MILNDQAGDMRHTCQEWKKSGLQVGFVPTMGALHEGHLTLVRRALAENDKTVISIFVNPTQFNDPEDYKKYPRNLSQDIRQLESFEDLTVFHPSEEAIYPSAKKMSGEYDFGYLATMLEGAHRPGHFAGVGQVVARLLHFVPASKLYLGQKDYQQFLVISKLIHDILKLPIEIICCPIIREPDGLAMSSRNVRLNKEQRRDAAVLFETLLWAKNNYKKISVSELEQQAISMISAKEHVLGVDYFKVVSAVNLKTPPSHKIADDSCIALSAVNFEGVRLIDNIMFK